MKEKENEAILKTEVYNRELKGKVCKRRNIYPEQKFEIFLITHEKDETDNYFHMVTLEPFPPMIGTVSIRMDSFELEYELL
ncbi:MAG: hypothetical protein K0B10_08400 [Vicingaceae bacterium]|nr:hypothetical protein [Vicingaceae bacterium]